MRLSDDVPSLENEGNGLLLDGARDFEAGVADALHDLRLEAEIVERRRVDGDNVVFCFNDRCVHFLSCNGHALTIITAAEKSQK